MSEDNPKMRSMFGGESSGGFFGLPVAQPGEIGDADIVLIGAPSATPYESVGPYCAGAPDAIRSAFGWPGVLDHHDFDLGGKVLVEGVSAVDWGNLIFGGLLGFLIIDPASGDMWELDERVDVSLSPVLDSPCAIPKN